MITARAWCRVDLAGGTLDIWPLGLFHPGARTVNVAIDVAATVRLERREGSYRLVQRGSGPAEQAQVVEAGSAEELARHPEGALLGTIAAALDLPPFSAELASGSPRGGGLGGSSALAVAFLSAAEEEFGLPRSTPEQRAHLARDLEARLMRLPTGLQDHYPALLGGALEIEHRPGREQVRRIPADLVALGERLLVVYSGQSHFSAGNNWEVVRRRLDGEPEVIELFAGIAAVSGELAAALEAGDFAAVGALMSREWSFRRRLAPGIATPVLARLFDAALAAGAWGGKACGAGGGGCLAFLCPPERRAEVARRLGELGGQAVPALPVGEPLLLSRS
jgi:D-glycero-alpha-D-manno-heptose-7-phosphate kinase